ncbi:MAG TPA: PilZ domain-containing protein [Gemmatimonadales bacterium]|nr:PilZ domain-containing protein [Gemmatimonadales bacterium]
MTSIPTRWSATHHLDRRALPRAEYRRTSPALLELLGLRCAVRDLGLGGLRVEPAPGGRVWSVGQEVSATLVLRSGERVEIEARIGRIDRSGLAFFPDGERWPTTFQIESERAALNQRQRERRSDPRLPMPVPAGGSGAHTPLRDISATGLRYALTPYESAPAIGSRIEGALQLDPETVIEVHGRVVRLTGREVAVAFDPPGLEPGVLEGLRRRFFGGGGTGVGASGERRRR